MTERCPLSKLTTTSGTPVDIPEVCLRQCEARMTEATRGVGDWDDYLRGEAVPNGEVEFSHDAVALASLTNRSARHYSVVDRVTTEHDWQEIGETTYTFDCPHA